MAAVSGGPDSMALLAVLQSLHARGLHVGAVVVGHLNHRLRAPASDRDALFVAASARAAGVAGVVGEVAARPRRENEEAWARRVRYRFLGRVQRAAVAAAVCVAHTRDDQAETVLLRLGRGAGPRALAGMAPRRDDGVVRPLLERTRDECSAYLRACGGLAVRDATNADTTRLRSRARHVVLPALEEWLGVDMRARLARLASDLRVECALAEGQLSRLLPAAGSRAGLPVASVVAAGDAGPRLVHAWLARSDVRPGERPIAAIVRLARAASPSGAADVGGGLRVERCYEVLEVVGPTDRGAERGGWAPIAVAIPGPTVLPNGWRLSTDWLEPGGQPRSGTGLGFLSAVLSADAVRLPLIARAPRPGDRIRLGRGCRKVSDALIDARIPRRDRAGLFVVTDPDDTLVWVPGVRATPWAEAAGATGRRIVLAAQRL